MCLLLPWGRPGGAGGTGRAVPCGLLAAGHPWGAAGGARVSKERWPPSRSRRLQKLVLMWERIEEAARGWPPRITVPTRGVTVPFGLLSCTLCPESSRGVGGRGPRAPGALPLAAGTGWLSLLALFLSSPAPSRAHLPGHARGRPLVCSASCLCGRLPVPLAVTTGPPGTAAVCPASRPVTSLGHTLGGTPGQQGALGVAEPLHSWALCRVGWKWDGRFPGRGHSAGVSAAAGWGAGAVCSLTGNLGRGPTWVRPSAHVRIGKRKEKLPLSFPRGPGQSPAGLLDSSLA